MTNAHQKYQNLTFFFHAICGRDGGDALEIAIATWTAKICATSEIMLISRENMSNIAVLIVSLGI